MGEIVGKAAGLVTDDEVPVGALPTDGLLLDEGKEVLDQSMLAGRIAAFTEEADASQLDLLDGQQQRVGLVELVVLPLARELVVGNVAHERASASRDVADGEDAVGGESGGDQDGLSQGAGPAVVMDQEMAAKAGEDAQDFRSLSQVVVGAGRAPAIEDVDTAVSQQAQDGDGGEAGPFLPSASPVDGSHAVDVPVDLGEGLVQTVEIER